MHTSWAVISSMTGLQPIDDGDVIFFLNQLTFKATPLHPLLFLLQCLRDFI